MLKSKGLLAVLASYDDKFKVFMATPGREFCEWRHMSEVPSDAHLDFSMSMGPTFADAGSDPRVPSASIVTQQPPTVKAPNPTVQKQVRKVERITPFLPNYKDISDPAMLETVIRPSAIHSVDHVRKSAVISFPKSTEKATVSLSDLLSSNPELLANWLVQHAL
jgi:hypothetical protein